MKRPVTYLFSVLLAFGLVLLPAAAYAACPHDLSEQCGSRETSDSFGKNICSANGCAAYGINGNCDAAPLCPGESCVAPDKSCGTQKAGGDIYGFFSRYICSNGSRGDLLSLLMSYGSRQPATGTDTDIVPDEDTVYDEYVSAVIDMMNKERGAAGLGQLVPDEGLMEAAAIRAAEIRSSFAHTRPDGTSCFTVLDETGVSYLSAGENIALGQKDPQQVMTDWMNSPGHRANILNPGYGRTGVAAIPNTTGSGYAWVQLFAD